MEQSHSAEAILFSTSQENPRILWNPEVHYRIHSSRPLYLSWAKSIQSMLSHPTSWRPILILSSHLRLGLPNGLFPSGFPIETLNKPLLSPIRAAYPAHVLLSRFDHPDNNRWRVHIITLLIIHSLVHSPLTSSLVGPVKCNHLIKKSLHIPMSHHGFHRDSFTYFIEEPKYQIS